MTWLLSRLLSLAANNPLTLLWIAGGVFLAGVAAGGSSAWTVQGWRLSAVTADFNTFKRVAEAQGIAAAKEAARIDRVHTTASEAANAKIKRLSTDNASLVKRLRDANPPVSTLPPPPADTKRPDLLCLDRAEYQREDGILIAKLFEGARSLADEGTANTLKLSTAEEWAASLSAQ